MILATVLAVSAILIFGAAVTGLMLNHRRSEARKAAQLEWDAILDRLNSEECARAFYANRNFEWRD